jgi:type I restriction enzyme, S subunit
MWKTVKLGEICNFEGGSQPPKKEFVYEPADGYVRFLQIRDFKSDKNITYIPIAKKNRLCAETDILIGRYGASVGQILSGLSGAYNVALMKTIPNEELISKGWLHAYLTSPLFQKPLMEVSSRSAQNGFSKDDIYDFDVPLPPLAEQQRIVAKLDAAFAEIDTAIAAAEKNAENAEALYDDMLEGIITSRNSDNVVMLSDVASIESKLADPKEEPYKSMYHVGAGNIESRTGRMFELQTAEQEKLISNKFPFDESMVLYSKIRPYLRKASLPDFKGICSADMYPLSPNESKLNRTFLFHLLMSKFFTEYAISGSARAGMPKVNRNHLFAFEFPLPPFEEQLKASENLEILFELTEEFGRLQREKSTQFQSLKSALLTSELTNTSEAA